MDLCFQGQPDLQELVLEQAPKLQRKPVLKNQKEKKKSLHIHETHSERPEDVGLDNSVEGSTSLLSLHTPSECVHEGWPGIGSRGGVIVMEDFLDEIRMG